MEVLEIGEVVEEMFLVGGVHTSFYSSYQHALIVGLALVFLIALLVFRSYLIKKRTNKILDHQKAEIERLLLNILPAEVAKELQVKG